MQALLRTQKPRAKEEEQAQPAGGATDKVSLEKEYDKSIKQLAADRRAQPVQRTKTEEEIAEEESSRLKELEAQRLRRMQGIEAESEDEDEDEEEKVGRTQRPPPARPLRSSEKTQIPSSSGKA